MNGMRAAQEGKAPTLRVVVAAQEKFPPLTTSLQTFVKDGSDRTFRRLIYDLTSLFNQMMRNRKQFATYIGVSEAQLLMMTIIAEMRESTVGQIAQQLNVSSQFATIEVGDLVRKEILEKHPNEADRRSMFLHLTAKGQRLLCELAPLRRRINDIHFGSLTEDRARVLHEIVSTLIADGKSAGHELDSPDLHGKKAPSTHSDSNVRKSTSPASPSAR
jgi:DNA-binding MarR family transcriptional regulator